MNPIDPSTINPLDPPILTYGATQPVKIDPPFGVIGLPNGVKETAQRADFRPDPFVIACEAHGYRLAWTRAAPCPCLPLAVQTDQADPNCPNCSGSGVFYFGPGVAQDINLIGFLNEVQKAIIAKTGAFVIRAIMTALSSQKTPFEKFGNWRSGTGYLTTRTENKVGYYDRLVALDSLIAHDEIITSDGSNVLKTRYLVDGGVNLVMDQNFKRYYPGQDFVVNIGRITWTGKLPARNTRFAAHYFTHPTWLVTSHPHTIRAQNLAAKEFQPDTPEGNNFELPIQATVQLEFLVHPDETPPPQ